MERGWFEPEMHLTRSKSGISLTAPAIGDTAKLATLPYNNNAAGINLQGNLYPLKDGARTVCAFSRPWSLAVIGVQGYRV